MNIQAPVIWSATPTPFFQDGALDPEAVNALVEQHLSLGVTGLLLAGTCGEGPFMTNNQRAELVQTVRRAAGDRLVLAVQVSDTSAARVRENMSRAHDAGADYVVVAPPWIERFSNRDFLRRYFCEALESAETPVGLYVLKTPPDSPLNLSLWQELASDPKVRLIKDSSACPEYGSAFAAIRGRRPEVVLLTGNEFDVLTPLGQGYDGALLGTGILIAGMLQRAAQASRAGKSALAEEWQTRSNAFLRDLFGRDLRIWLGGLKYALVRLGIFNTPFMHLAYSLQDEDRRRIEEALEREMQSIRPEQPPRFEA